MIHIDKKYLQLVSSRLRNFKQKDTDLYNFSCPYCGDSTKNRSKARGYAYRYKTQMNVKCHNCGVGTTVGKMIEMLDESLYKEYCRERFVENGHGGRGNHQDVKYTIDHDFKKPKPARLIDKLMDRCDKLPDDHKAVVYLKSRMIPDDKFYLFYYADSITKIHQLNEKYEDSLKTDEERLAIPFFNHRGDLIGLTLRSFSDTGLRYITINISDDPLIYGLERLDYDKDIYVTEGAFDSLFIPNAIAANGSSLKKFKKYLPLDRTTLIYDNQPRNPEICKIIEDAIEDGLRVVLWPETPGKDINEMIKGGWSKEKILKIVKDHAFSGMKAKLKFSEWRKA